MIRRLRALEQILEFVGSEDTIASVRRRRICFAIRLDRFAHSGSAPAVGKQNNSRRRAHVGAAKGISLIRVPRLVLARTRHGRR